MEATPAVIVEALPAGYGDSLLVTCNVRRGVWRLLVNTGPDECWPMLKARLAQIPPDKSGRRRIDLAVISHIDHDHTGGARAWFGDRDAASSTGDGGALPWRRLAHLGKRRWPIASVESSLAGGREGELSWSTRVRAMSPGGWRNGPTTVVSQTACLKLLRPRGQGGRHGGREDVTNRRRVLAENRFALHLEKPMSAKPRFHALAAALMCAALSSSAAAALLQGPAYIAASTTVPTCGPYCGGFGANINEIADGSSANFNGFAGATGVLGTIKLDLLGDFDLSSFSLWNDVNVLNEGVRSFQLDFFDAADQLISSTGVLAAVSPSSALSPPAVYAFSTVNDVSRVDMRVLTVSGRIEVRELAFNGEPAGSTGSVPEPASLALVAAGLFAGAAARRRTR